MNKYSNVIFKINAFIFSIKIFYYFESVFFKLNLIVKILNFYQIK